MSIFYNKFKNEELNKAYDLLENVTPLPYDCGKICSNRCCKGSDTDGMLLFPFEKEYFENNPSFKVWFDEKNNNYTVVCLSPCKRDERPLSCRLFPLFPYLQEGENGENINIALDIRALDICPIASRQQKFDRKFLRNVRIATNVLIRNPEIASFLKKTGKDMLDLGELNK